MLTVDFDRLGLRPGDRVLDMGCGAGRHAFEMFRRGADVVAFDQDGDELASVLDLFGAMREAGEAPLGADADIKQGDALALPFADEEFDRVVAAEVLEHIPADTAAIDELVRVLRPGGTIAVSVPRWLPERICWALSDAYHANEGGHVRIYTGDELVGKLRAAGLAYDGRDHVHGLHAPYWWLKCAVGVDKERAPARHGVPPDAGVGHHEAAAGHPAGREGARPAHRQEPGALPPQARVHGPARPHERRDPRAARPARPARRRRHRRLDRPRCRSPTAPCRGSRAATPTPGTTWRRRWACWSVARPTRRTVPTTGAWPRSATTARGR